MHLLFLNIYIYMCLSILNTLYRSYIHSFFVSFFNSMQSSLQGSSEGAFVRYFHTEIRKNARKSGARVCHLKKINPTYYFFLHIFKRTTSVDLKNFFTKNRRITQARTHQWKHHLSLKYAFSKISLISPLIKSPSSSRYKPHVQIKTLQGVNNIDRLSKGRGGEGGGRVACLFFFLRRNRSF